MEMIKAAKEDYGSNSFHDKPYDITIVKGLENSPESKNNEEVLSK